MVSLVVYDSTYGNTAALAAAIGSALGPGCRVAAVAEARWEDVAAADLVVMGSPTQGGRPTAGLSEFIGRASPGALTDKRVAAFDTRLDPREQNLALRLLMRVIGYAAPRILRMLESRGAVAVAPPEAFIVEAKEGPLRDGELQRAAEWARRLTTA